MSLKAIAKKPGGTISEVLHLPIADFDIDPGFNVRQESPALTEHIRNLADLILANGFMKTKPLTVRAENGRAVIVDGHCRFAAAKLAISEGAAIINLPCVSEPRGSNEADRALQLLTANAGMPLSPLEQADVIKRLISYGWPEAEIARKIGRSTGHIRSMLDLASAPAAVQTAIRSGGIAATEAAKVMREHGRAAPRVIADAQAAARKRGKVRATARDVAEVTQPTRSRPSTHSLAEAAARAWMTWDRTSALPEPVERTMDALAEAFRG